MPKYIHKYPEWIFFIFSTLSGLTLCFLIPPLGGGKEVFDFERAISVTYGHFRVEKAEVASGLIDFTSQSDRFFQEGLQAPFSYPLKQGEKLAGIKLGDRRTEPLLPSPLTVHHPFCFLPQAFAMRLALAFASPSPLILLYLARLAGLGSAIALTFYAIRLMPSHRWALAALALLPPITFSRSCVDSDQLTNGMAFLFIAYVLREVVKPGSITKKSIALLCALAFVLAQCKNVYLMLPLLTLAIPASRFASRAQRWVALAIIILPGMLASLGWMLMVKQSYLAGMTYHTQAGDVNPDAQMAFILHHPLAYLGIFCRTLFLTPFFPQALVGIIATFGPPFQLSGPVMLLLLALFILVVGTDNTSQLRYRRPLALIVAILFLAFLALSLTSLYSQWTGLGAPLILGFQGRYFYPLLPLLLIFTRRFDFAARLSPAAWLILFAVLGHGALIWTSAYGYYGPFS